MTDTNYNLRNLKKMAAMVDATVEVTHVGSATFLEVRAPRGMKWNEGGALTLVDVAEKPWKNDYKDVMSRMSYGLSDGTNDYDPEDWD